MLKPLVFEVLEKNERFFSAIRWSWSDSFICCYFLFVLLMYIFLQGFGFCIFLFNRNML